VAWGARARYLWPVLLIFDAPQAEKQSARIANLFVIGAHALRLAPLSSRGAEGAYLFLYVYCVAGPNNEIHPIDSIGTCFA
jgi:hypothetical protein